MGCVRWGWQWAQGGRGIRAMAKTRPQRHHGGDCEAGQGAGPAGVAGRPSLPTWTGQPFHRVAVWLVGKCSYTERRRREAMLFQSRGGRRGQR